MYAAARRLAGSTTLGQIILVAFLPLITRLYTPGEFGEFAYLYAFCVIAGSLSTLRLEIAIGTDLNDDSARLTAYAGISCVLFVAPLISVGAFFIFIGQYDIIQGFLLWLTVTAIGLTQVCEQYDLRHGDAKRIGVARAVGFTLQGIFSVCLGLFGLGAIGLILAVSASWVCRFLIILGTGSVRNLGSDFPSCRMVFWQIWAHRRVVYFSWPSFVLQMLSHQLPTILSSIFFGSVAAGGVALAQRLVLAPVRLIGLAISQGVLTRVARMSSVEKYRYANQSALVHTAAGAFLTVLGIVGSLFVTEVFGADWAILSSTLFWFSMVGGAYFARIPVNQLLLVLGLYKHELQYSVSIVSWIILTFLAGHYSRVSIEGLLPWFALGIVVITAVQMYRAHLLSLRAVQKNEEGTKI